MTRRVLSFDPGETTGVCCIDYDIIDGRAIFLGYNHLEEIKNNHLIPDKIAKVKPNTIVYERFGLYPGRAKALSHNALLPVEAIGLIKYVADDLYKKIVCQPASMIKRVKLSDVQKKLCGSSPHIQDACKHAIVFIYSQEGKEYV